MRGRPFLGALLFLVVGAAAIAVLVAVLAMEPGRSYSVVVYADRTLQAPLEEIVNEFLEGLEGRGVKAEVLYFYGSSGFVLAQLELRGGGDLYVSDGWEFALQGLEKGLLDSGYFQVVGCIRLALLVAEGNPKGVSSLEDALSRGDVTIAIGNPEHVTAGVLAWSLFQELGLEGEVERLVSEGRVVYADSASQAASYVIQGVVDTAISFNTYLSLRPQELDEVYDPVVASVKAPIVVALPVERGPLAVELFEHVVASKDVFAKYGADPDASC